MKTKKRFLSLLICIALALSIFTVPAGAVTLEQSTEHADILAALNLFQGTEKGYELESKANRIQGLVMFLRLLGLEDEALAYTGSSPFTDLEAWSKPYVAYAYSVGLTDGVSESKYDPNNALDAKTYLTFLLRGLGYSDSRGDFTWAKAVEFAEQDGLAMLARGSAEAMKDVTLTRGDMVSISYVALTHYTADAMGTLANKLYKDGVFSLSAAQDTNILNISREQFVYGETGSANPPVVTSGPVDFSSKTISTSAGDVSAYVLTVDTSDPSVRVETRMVDKTLGATAAFADIVAQSGALAVINGNFFESYEDFQKPIGHVMVDGEMLFGVSGLSSLGIGENGELQIGRPPIFTRIQVVDSYVSWAAYEVNSTEQHEYNSILYTPAFGDGFVSSTDAYIMVVNNGRISSYRSVYAGETVAIPADGFTFWMPATFTSTSYFSTPEVGASVRLEYFLQSEDKEGFSIDGVISMVTGAPRLVKDGAIYTELDAGFTEDRFTSAVTPRTAVGIDKGGRLVIASVGAASIQQMRELMLALGCVDAINLDGGASRALYYNGEFYATPGRRLTTTLHIFLDR